MRVGRGSDSDSGNTGLEDGGEAETLAGRRRRTVGGVGSRQDRDDSHHHSHGIVDDFNNLDYRYFDDIVLLAVELHAAPPDPASGFQAPLQRGDVVVANFQARVGRLA